MPILNMDTKLMTFSKFGQEYSQESWMYYVMYVRDRFQFGVTCSKYDNIVKWKASNEIVLPSSYISSALETRQEKR